ncbi:DEAD/DEAH box helicase [Nocardioides plantarum]|uniref:DEAD/DEAH box helicase n=1 Tax=Nocardioides plantarum TaxID=29299 RepID=A0ABV5KG91_9ACTN|nr:helicase-related protein [Nocardioides plantarum]
MSTDSQERPDLEHELSILKDFQRATVEMVHDRLWHPDDPTRRFLVADEVGLGKTLVARGVIAKTIEHLWDSVDRIDVVYICSNSQIARQNLPKLRIGGGVARHDADRLTMLASQLRHLQGRKLNFISFTPDTSFNLRSNGGRAEERVLLYRMLKIAEPRVRPGPWTEFFRCTAGHDKFKRHVRDHDDSVISAELAKDFEKLLLDDSEGEGSLLDDVIDCVEEFRMATKVSYGLSSRRYALMGRLRRSLARAAVTRLQPDLVILDEFQRFKDLLADEGEGAELARELFDHADCRLLMLSATPFKMYTLPDEPEGDDHYRDFVDTIRFLAGNERAARVKSHMAGMRSGLYARDLDRVRRERDAAQTELRRVMCRTERLATTADRDGFVVECEWPLTKLVPEDVRDYRRLGAVAKVVGGQDPLEFWRSSPFVLELMERYQVKDRLTKHAPDDPALVAAFATPGGSRLTWSDVSSYAAIDPGNAKMRGLVGDVLDRGAWKLLWIPPSLPYYKLDLAYADAELVTFTKRLIFSAWAVAPKAISTVLSYEAERRISERARETSTSSGFAQYDATRPTGLLTFNRSAEGRNTGMPVFGLLYPSVTLSELGDPLAVARDLGQTLPLSWAVLEGEVRRRVAAALAELPLGPSSGAEDERWYWATGALLDRQREADLMGELTYGFSYEEHDDHRRFDDHCDEASAITSVELGRRPADLEEVLVMLAIGGPGNAAVRSLAQLSGGSSTEMIDDVREAASAMAWSLRNLFNKPEVMGIVRGGSDGAYWQDVLAYCVHGGLGAVLDEYVYVLDQLASATERGARALEIARSFDEAVSLRTAAQTFTDVQVRRHRVDLTTRRTRSHLAVRFGRGVAEDDSSAMREGQVRAAFNSPFWPFVLASTSVGQEGLDFHQYSHAVVHWNLPANPVDLEQREGRVHRYQGHAVRKNVASVYGGRPEVVAAISPWRCVFELAAADREPGASEIYPSWIPPLDGPARIERYIPALPLSREAHALRRLLRTFGAYRMVLGQPRQADLLRYLGDLELDLADLAIDLEPPPLPLSTSVDHE